MITFNEDGTIRIEDLDLTLKRPTIGDVWHLEDMAADAVRGYLDETRKVADKLGAYGPDDELPQDIADEARKFSRQGLLTMFMDWYVEATDRLGDKRLPKRVEEWPPDFLDPNLPVRIVEHWKQHPKASGANQQ